MSVKRIPSSGELILMRGRGEVGAWLLRPLQINNNWEEGEGLW
jgi:hypothetical protein